MAHDPYRYYRVEAREILDALGHGAQLLEKGSGGPERVNHLLRLAHTLKGASRVVKQVEVASLAHEVEEKLAPHRDAGAVPQARAREVLRLARDMGTLLAAIDQPKGQAADDRGSLPAQEPIEAIRIDIEDADAVLRILSEQGGHVAALRRELAALDGVRQLATSVADQLSPRRGLASNGQSARARAAADDLCGDLGRLQRGLSAAVDQAERDQSEARAAVERLRLAPTGTLFTPLERAARDAALALGKRVEVLTAGGEDRLDVGVLSPLRQALLHVVRNAVAHGIEAPAERAAAGKPEIGRVEISIERRGNLLAFACRDDGRGIDVEAVRRAAVERGVVGATAAGSLGAEETLRLLLRGGITTSRSVSQFSGRGIGLDVVRETAAHLHGEVLLKSVRGSGTTVELSVPVTLSSVTVLLLHADGARAAVPLEAVRRALRLAPGETIHSAGGDAVLDAGKAVPFMRLSAVLGRQRPRPNCEQACSAVVIDDGSGRVAIGADRLLGVQNVLVRPLPPLAPSSPLVSGVAIEAAGMPELVLDPRGLVAAVRAGAHAAGEEAAAAPEPVLVVDDSLTTRMLERSILESAGYPVDVAVSAEEALAKARERRYGLFVVDVELPGMDGYEFVARARADPALRGTPAILVTSRSSPEDRRRGAEVGARAFIVKSEFDQVRLLRTIRELMA